MSLAGTRERAGLRRGSSPPHAAPNGDKVRAPNDQRLHRDHAAHSIFYGEKPMTAYLISLALIGLVVVAVSEELS
jgi:hypothetical protein